MGLSVANFLGQLEQHPDDDGLIQGLREALASDDPEIVGDNPTRLIEAARVGHERRGEWVALAALLDLEAEQTRDDPKFRAALLKELGRIRHEELLDDEQALVALRKSVEIHDSEEVRDFIKRVEENEANWRTLADRFIEEADDAADPALKTGLLVRASTLVWQFRRKGRARETDKLFKQALKSDPSSTRAARLYAVTLKARNRWKDVAKVYTDTAGAARNRDEKLALFLHAGRVYAHKLSEPASSAVAFKRVLDFSPGHEEALRFLVEYYTEREDWDDLVALYEDALRSRQKLESEQGILLQIGMVHWRIRKAPAEADPYFSRLRKIDPAHPGVVDFYREYLSRENAGEDGEARLITILGDALRVAQTSKQKLELATELANAAEEKGATERAIDAWKAVQRIDPTNDRAATALRTLYRDGEKWNALVEVMRAEIDALPDEESDRRVQLLRELVPIYREHLQLDVMVINTYNAILSERSTDEEALAELARTYESMGRWNDLIQVHTKQAEATEDVATKVDLHMKVARLWVDRFANYNQATRPLEKIVELNPEHRDALTQLKEIYTKKRAWQSLYEVVRKESELASDPTARLAMRVELATLAGERLHRHTDAIALWRGVIDEAPETEGALQKLEKLADREKDWATLAHALEMKAAGSVNIKEQTKTLQKLGTIYGEHLDDPVKAASAWKRILELDPKNGRALRTLRESFLAAKDWEGLHELYADAGDWEGLVDVLGSAAERSDDNDLKIELSLRAARIYEEQLEAPHRAFRNYERVLGVDANHPVAAERLIPIYERDEKWSRLVPLLVVQLDGLPDDASDDERIALITRIRDLSGSRLRDDAAAYKWAARGFEVRPTDPEVVTALEACADAASRHAQVVGLYRARIDHEDASGDERLALRRRVAELSSERLGKTEDAIAELQRILEETPGDRGSVEVLDRIYRAEARQDDLRDLFNHRLEHADEEDEKLELLREVAALEEDVLGDGSAACARHRAILDINASDERALTSLDRLLVSAQEWGELAGVLRRRLEVSDDAEEHVELTGRLGVVCQRLDDPSGAIDAYASVLELDPTNESAVSGLEEIGEDAKYGVRVGRLLEDPYEETGRYEKLADVLRGRLADAETDAEEKRTLRLRLATLSAERLGDVAGAYSALESAFLDHPSDPELWDRLAQTAESANKQDDLAQAYATVLESAELDPSDFAELSRRLAHVYDVVLARPLEAEPHHRAVLGSDPLDGRAFEALKELYTENERWDELQVLYRNRIAETVDTESKLELLNQVCFLFEEILDDPALAIRAHQEVIDLEPNHAPSRRALERLFRRTNRSRDLVALIQQEVGRVEGAERIERMQELGELYEQKLDEPGSAVDYYEQILDSSPTHLRAQEALERLLDEKSQRQRVAAILEPLYESQGAWAPLARVIEVEIEDRSDPVEQVSLLMRAADLHENRLNDPAAAFASFARAVKIEPTNRDVRGELARVAAIRGAQAERATVLEEAVGAAEGSTVLQSELLLELAELFDGVDDLESAERTYQRLISTDGDNPDVVLPAARALERIHLGSRNFKSLSEDLRRQIKLVTDPDERARLLVRLAELLEEELGDDEGAIAAYRQLLDADPTDLTALTALERLYERRQDWLKLIGVLQSREQGITSEDEQRALSRRVGAIYEAKLEDVDNAIIAYNDVLSRFGPDRETLAALASLYESESKWTDLLEVVELQLDSADGPLERAELLFRAGELMRERTGDVERSIDVYGEVLALTPGHAGTIAALEAVLASDAQRPRVDAARALVPHYESSAAHANLIAALEVTAEGDDPVQRLSAYRRAAEVADVGLSEPGRAFELMGRAVVSGSSEPDLPVMLADLERHAAASSKWAEYAGVLKNVAPDVMDEDQQTSVLMKVAEVSRNFLDDSGAARSYYGKVLENRPEHTDALDALEELHEEAGDFSALLTVVRRKTDITDDGAQRVELLLRQATICETQLDDVPAAIDANEQVLAETEREEAYGALQRLYTRAERWHDLSLLYERQLDGGTGNPVELRYSLGKVFVDHLNDGYRGLDCFKLSVEQDNSHDPSIAELEKLMATDEHRSTAASILEPVFLQRMDWPRVTGALEARLSDERDLVERKQILRRLGQIHEDYLEDLDGGLEVYARLFREDPVDREVWDTLSRLTNVLEKWPRLGEIYAGALDTITDDDPDTAQLSALTGRIFDERAGDVARSIPFYRRALSFDANDTPTFEALESAHERLEQWSPLLDLYSERVEIADEDAERVRLLHLAARVREQRTDDAPAAIDTYRRVLEIAPGDESATLALDRLLTTGERWPELGEHLRLRIDNADDPRAAADLKHRLATLSIERLGDKHRAIDTWEELLESDPGYAPAISALEKHVMDDDLQLRITQLLEPIYRGSDEWKKLIAILEAQVSLTDAREEKTRLLGEVGRLHEERGRDGALAFNAWARAFAADPSSTDSRSELDRLAALLSTWDEHVAAYGQAIDNADDPALVSQLLATVARVHDERRGDPRAAIETYERLANHDPDDPSALDALEALHTMVGDWRGLVDVLNRKVDRSLDPAERAELLRRGGSVLEELLGDPRGAIEMYERAVDEDADDDVGLEALDRLYGAASMSEKLANVLRRRIDLEQDASMRSELGLRLGQLEDTQLNRPLEAIDAYTSVLGAHASHPEAVHALTRLYERQAMWPALLDNLRLAAGIAPSTQERVGIVHRSGEVLERELDDVVEAITMYQQALQLDNRHEPSLQALFRICHLEDYRERASETLEPLLHVQERWDELAELIKLKAGGARDPRERRDELRRLAEVHENGRRDLDSAFESLAEALAEDPSDDETARHLERVASKNDGWAQLANVLQRRAASSLQPTVARALFQRLAVVAEERLGDEAMAVQAYSRAAEQVGDDEELLESLDRLHSKARNHSELADVLERRAGLAGDPSQRSELLIRLGQLRQEHFQDLRGAFVAFREVLDRDPTDLRAMAALEGLTENPELARDVVEVLDNAYREVGATDRVAGLYDTRIELAESDGERVRLLQEAAALWETELGDNQRALDAVRRAFETDPRDADLLGDLERLAAASGNWESLRGVVERVSESSHLDRDLVRDIHLRAASWYRDRLGDVPSAEACLQKVVEADPDTAEGHAQLVELLRQPGREEELVEALRVWSGVEYDEDARKERLREAARLAESALGDNATAGDCYEAVLSIDRGDTIAIDDLARIRMAEGRWSHVADLLERRAEVTVSPDDRLDIRRQLAEVYEGPLADSARAMRAYQEILDDAPEELEAIDALERLYQEGERWTDLRGLLDRRLDIASTDDERIVARVRLARLQEQAFGRRAEAIEQLTEILEMQSDNVEALNELERLLAAEEAWSELVGWLEHRVGLTEGAAQAEVLRRLAAVHEERRGDAPAAIASLARAIDVDPTDVDSIKRLEQLHRNAGNYAETASTLEQLISLLAPDESVAYALSLANVAEEHLGDAARAEAALRQAYQVAPDQALEPLREHFEKHGRYQELAELLVEEAMATSDDALQVDLLKRAASIHQEQLADPATAASYLERAAQLTPDDRDVLLPLCDLYIEAGREVDAVPVLEQIIASFGKRRSKEIAKYHHRLGRALEGMDRIDDALSHYDSAFKIDLTNVPVLRDLGRLCHAQGDLARAQKTFRALLLQKLGPDAGIAKADVYFFLGDISAKQGDARKAISMLERALSEDRGHARARELLDSLK